MSEGPHFANDSAPAGLSLESLAAMLRAAMVDGRWANTRLGEHAAAYLDALEYQEASANTLAAYEHVLALFCVEHADLTLEDLHPPQGAATVRAFLDRHWRSSAAATRSSAAATRRQRLAIVRSFLTWLVGEGLLRANPAVNVKGPKEKRRVREALSFDAIEALIASQPTLRDQVALSLLAFLGLRKDELRRLQVRDIDLDGRTVVVHGKGGHVDTLPLAFERVHDAVRLHLIERQPERPTICSILSGTRIGRWTWRPSTAGSRRASGGPGCRRRGLRTTCDTPPPTLSTR